VSGQSFTRDYVLAVSGLKAEAHLAMRSPQTMAVAGGGQPKRLDRLIEDAITPDCCGLISFGIAAGLRPDLRPGACLIAREVVDASARYLADISWATRLKARLDQASLVRIAGVDRPLTTAVEKKSLFDATGAAGADMESHLVARMAVKHELPFAVLRVVSDPAARALPGAALAGMRKDGSTDAAATLRALMKEPSQIPGLVRVGLDAARAYLALLGGHRRLGPGLGLFDLG
jgi:hopanoid-associated phosphorylase